MPIIIDDGHPKARRIALGKADKALLTSRVLEKGGGYVGIVVGVVQQTCDDWPGLVAFMQSMGIEDIPSSPPTSNLNPDLTVN